MQTPLTKTQPQAVSPCHRLPDWEEGLWLVEASFANKPPQWGVNDCAMLACRAVQAVTGEHPCIELQGAYQDARGAVKALCLFLEVRDLFVPGMRQDPGRMLWAVARAVARKYEWEEVAPGLAQRGDVVLLNPQIPQIPPMETPWFDKCLGFIGLGGLPLTAGEHGIVEVAAENLLTAWRIPA